VDIENNNNILVTRMMRAPSTLRSQTDAFLKDSLNSGYRFRRDKEIDEGNQVITKLFRN
jgi:hypothetical protein